MKTAIFGGTFSPPHLGHVALVKAYFEHCDCDRLLIMPVNIPPHKVMTDFVGPEHRYNMCALTFKNLEGIGEKIEISDFEIKSSGKSYTALTLSHFSSGKEKIDLLMGTDMFLTVDDWYHPETIFRLADLVLMRRENDKENTKKIEKQKEKLQKLGASFFEIDAPAVEISSTEIRKTLAEGKKPEMLTDETYNYIVEKKLYVKA